MIVSFYYVTIMISDYCLVGNWEQFIHSFIQFINAPLTQSNFIFLLWFLGMTHFSRLYSSILYRLNMIPHDPDWFGSESTLL